jgi:hypothetical protein
LEADQSPADGRQLLRVLSASIVLFRFVCSSVRCFKWLESDRTLRDGTPKKIPFCDKMGDGKDG